MRNVPGRKSQADRFAFSFDYTDAVRKLCEDICFRVPEFGNIRMDRVAVSFSQTRNNSSYGVYASLTPLRFEGGRRTMLSRGKEWEVQRLPHESGVGDYLYILYVCVPRFMNLKLTMKLETIIHELFHIGPKFNGDLRRFEGRCYAHGSSVRSYDNKVRQLLKTWLDQDPPTEVWNFLQLNYRELCDRFGSVGGLKIPPPKIIPVR